MRLGYMGVRRLSELVNDILIENFTLNSYSICESCIQRKMTKALFLGIGYRARDLLELIHNDVCGPLNRIVHGGSTYFVTFTNDKYKYIYIYIYLMKHKSEIFDKFKIFLNKVEKYISKFIKCLRSDRDGEYISEEFRSYLREIKMLSQYSPSRTPQHNEMSKRRNHTLLEMVRTMMSYTSLHYYLWGYALLTTAHILNTVPSKTVYTTLYQI